MQVTRRIEMTQTLNTSRQYSSLERDKVLDHLVDSTILIIFCLLYMIVSLTTAVATRVKRPEDQKEHEMSVGLEVYQKFRRVAEMTRRHFRISSESSTTRTVQ